MKNKKYFGIAMILFIAALNPVSAAASDYGFLVEITSTSFLPLTISAGDTVSVAIDIKNRGSGLSIENLITALEVGNQFEAISLEDEVGNIKPRATKTAIMKFTVNEDTLPGYYPVFLTLNYLRDGVPITERQTISVPVSLAEKNVDVTVEPKIINPGNQTELIFRLKNISGTSISNVSFSWDESNDLILPLGSDNKRYVNNIKSNETKELVYIVAADPNISPGIYPIDVTISFTDVEGTKTQESEVGIIIGGETDFEVSAEVKNNQLSLSIANIGSNNAESVVIKIPKQNSVSISGTNIEIVGNLNKGDFTLANFNLQGTAQIRDSEVSGSTGMRIPGFRTPRTQPTHETDADFTGLNFLGGEILIQIDYTDTTGERHTVTKKIELSIESTGFAGSAPQHRTEIPIVPLALLGIILAGGIGFNKLSAKKDWKKLGIKIAIIIALFGITIIFLNSNIIALAIAAIVSLVLLWKFFGKKG